MAVQQKNRITVFTGGNAPITYDLDAFCKDTVRLGRGACHGDQNAEKNDIVVGAGASAFSRAHCTFYKHGGVWHVRDDQSVNGLYVRGVRIASQQLHDGDKFYIGKEEQTRCAIVFSSRRTGMEEAGKNDGELNRLAPSGRKKYVLGRSPECDIVINHPSVSRRHCIISCENGAYFITDNNSMNGVILNGRPLKNRQRLAQMDKIMIADTSLVFCDNSLYLTKNVSGVSVVAYEATKKVKGKGGEKCILDHVSLSIETGEFVAILGGSGAGKTTLLNCLSGMADFSSGDILVNGESIQANRRSIQSIIGYVPQSDIIYDNLTLERMLYYSAKLRMPKDTSRREIRQKIQETIRMVELEGHERTMIGKLSGGQKKRASIAVELLASPKLFFLDEPSSGLDPGTEKSLMDMLKRLTLTGKTVIMVTHTVQNIGMCDRVICMGKGGLLCFSGSPQDALRFFRKKSMTDIYDVLNEQSAAASQAFRKAANHSHEQAKSVTVKREKVKFGFADGIHQFGVMAVRYAEIMKNNGFRLLLLVLMPVILTGLVCSAFQADGNIYNYLKLQVNRSNFPFLVAEDTMKLLFAFSCAGFWVGIFNSVQEISKERNIYRREQFTGVRPIPYVLSKFVVIGALCLLQTLIMMLLFAYFTDTVATVNGDMNAVTSLELGMGRHGIVFSGSLWAELFITTLLSLLSAMCLGLAVSAAASNDMALIICPVCLLPQILFSGVACKLSGFTEVLSKIVTCRWACIAYFTSTDVNHMYYSCAYDMGTWQKTSFENGFGVDQAYAASTSYLGSLDPVRSAWVVLLGFSLGCLALSMLLLYIRKSNRA